MSDPREFGAVGDGRADDGEALQHALDAGDGTLHLSKGTYHITQPIVLDLTKQGYGAVLGEGGTARVVMDGPGPAFRIVGDHQGTATPKSVKPQTWENERFPTISGFEILGAHPKAVGIELRKTMQCTVTGMLIRNVRFGLHLIERNRNFLLSHSHIYDNREYGVFFDNCNLHQTIISANHISYNKRAGIKSLNGDVHNLHITGNDIEYNNLPGTEEPAADIWFEATAPNGRISEVSIVSNTIQATVTPGGANVRIHGEETDDPNKSPLITLTGNVIGSQDRAVELRNLNRISMTGNTIYNSPDLSIHAARCSGVAVGSNTIVWRATDEMPEQDGIYFEDCDNVSLHGLVTERLCSGSQESGGAITLVRCNESSVSDCQILDPMYRGVELTDCRNCRVSDNTVIDRRKQPRMRHGIRVTGGAGNLVQNNMLGPAVDARFEAAPDVAVAAANHEV
jgi:parallel beta-helix repeat protein